MDIIILEDDEKVGSFIKENLERDGHRISWIKTFQEFEEILNFNKIQPKLFILDRFLKNLDSRVLLTRIKEKFPHTFIMFLSALNTPSEKAKLLNEGADEYLGKPFSLIELQARVNALIRRKSALNQTQQDFFQFGDITIDFKTRTVICNGRKLDLTTKEYSLLLNFAENINRVFSKFQLLDIIWETNLDIESNVLEVNVMNLRKKLESCHSSVKILSKRNVGYWLEN